MAAYNGGMAAAYVKRSFISLKTMAAWRHQLALNISISSVMKAWRLKHRNGNGRRDGNGDK